MWSREIKIIIKKSWKITIHFSELRHNDWNIRLWKFMAFRFLFFSYIFIFRLSAFIYYSVTIIAVCVQIKAIYTRIYIICIGCPTTFKAYKIHFLNFLFHIKVMVTILKHHKTTKNWNLNRRHFPKNENNKKVTLEIYRNKKIKCLNLNFLNIKFKFNLPS